VEVVDTGEVVVEVVEVVVDTAYTADMADTEDTVVVAEEVVGVIMEPAQPVMR
jgi:hypothetical protein